ncbi:MAG: hypothetical protein Q8O76_03125, partial [Chloroflexota bacterium]|nr:hypothetical protein [Chloroflexota bacterium]
DVPMLRAQNSVGSASVGQLVEALAHHWGVSDDTVYRWVRRGKVSLPPTKPIVTDSYWDDVVSQVQSTVLALKLTRGNGKRRMVYLYLLPQAIEGLDRISVALEPFVGVKLRRPEVVSVLIATMLGAKAVPDAIEEPAIWQDRLLKQLRKWSRATEVEIDTHYWIWRQEECEWRHTHSKEVGAIEYPPGYDPANHPYAVGPGITHVREACARVLDYAQAMKQALPPEQWEWYRVNMVESWGWKAAYEIAQDWDAGQWERTREFNEYGWIQTTKWAAPKWEWGPDVAHRLVNKRTKNKN